MLVSTAGCGVTGVDDVLLPCGTPVSAEAPAAPPKGPASDATVLLLRGLVNTYSLGLDELNDALHADGVDSRMVDWPNWPGAMDAIEASTTERGSVPDLVLVGHSYGADDAVRLAASLGEQGIDVHLLILLEATTPPPIPANVVHCIHYYIPTYFGDNWPDAFAGNVVVPEPGNNRTIIENRYARALVPSDAEMCINHFNIDAVGPIQEIVVKDILSLGRDGASLRSIEGRE